MSYPPVSAILEAASQVIATEMEGMAGLHDALRDPDGQLAPAMERAVALCSGVKGRVIITGMGKSGHVARKITATLASTGTPASYVHPGEASHGDLGMISAADVVIALSNSGETAELGDVIGYTQRFSIPLIAMTSRADSTLARAATALLLIPRAPEACAITNAPTTSTTLMMALGDALAVAILQLRGFTSQDFHTFHPGGKLGAALKKVSDLMHHTDMPLAAMDATMGEAVTEINRCGFGCVGLLDEKGRLAGIITDGDLRRAYDKPERPQFARDIMTAAPRTLRADGLAAEALSLLAKFRITSLFIVDAENHPLGLLHVHDCLSSGVV
jgi:arabinose-5-phosphate isomerase